MIHQTEKIQINFGDAQTSPFTIQEFRASIDTPQRNILREKLKNTSNNALFLHQVHSDQGLIVSNNYQLSLEKTGDFLITNLKNIKIGILSADCLPIIFYDKGNHISAIAHAGWPGTLKYIAKNVLFFMKKKFNSDVSNIKVFFGPSAKVCCYEVDNVFYQKINNHLIDKTLIKRDNKFYFDIPNYNKLILQKEGVFDFNLDSNICTICNMEYCSFRRKQESSGLQMTTIELL